MDEQTKSALKQVLSDEQKDKLPPELYAELYPPPLPPGTPLADKIRTLEGMIAVDLTKEELTSHLPMVKAVINKTADQVAELELSIQAAQEEAKTYDGETAIRLQQTEELGAQGD